MKIRGFLVIIVLAAGIVYVLWLMQGGKEKMPKQIRSFIAARDELTKANMMTLKTAIFIFTSEEGRTPENLEELKEFGSLRGAHLDAWGTAIKYEKLSDEHFRLTSAGKDETFNTKDDFVLEF